MASNPFDSFDGGAAVVDRNPFDEFDSPDVASAADSLRNPETSTERPNAAVLSPAQLLGEATRFAGKSIYGGLADIGSELLGQRGREVRKAAIAGEEAPPTNIEQLVAGEPMSADVQKRFLPMAPRMALTGAQGLIETTPQLAATGALTAAGVPAPIAAGAIFGSTPEGFDVKQGAVAAALPFVGKYSGEIAGTIAKKYGVNSTTALNWLKGIAGTLGPAGYLGTIQESEIENLPEDQRKDARIDAIANIAGMSALGPMGVKFESPRPFIERGNEVATEPTPPSSESPRLGPPPEVVAESPQSTLGEPAAPVDPASLPELRSTDKAIKIQQPDGTIIDAVTNGKNWEIEGKQVPNVGRVVDINGKMYWSDGPLRPGEQIVEAKGGEQTNVQNQEKGQTQGDVLTEAPTEQISSGPGAAAAQGEIPESGLGKEIYGIAQRVREERARAGQVIEVEPGTGTTAPDSVERGRALLDKNPEAAEKAVAAFEADPARGISADGVAAARAKGEQLALIARRMEEQFGTNSDQFHRAWVELSKWDTRTKPMQTEWSKIGQAQQGHTDIDTGSFTGLQRAYRDLTEKDFTPQQAIKAKDISAKVDKAAKEANTANDELKSALDSELKLKKERDDAEQRAFDAANKTVREAAARLAETERKEAVARGKLQTATDKLAAKPDEAALKAANKTVREAAIRDAKTEAKRAQEQAKRDLKIAEDERKTEQKALDAANKTVREAAVRRAELEQKYANDPRLKVWEQTKKYLDEGLDNFNDIRTKVATDLGLSTGQVAKLLAQKGRLKTLADDLYIKQQAYRRFDETARRWLQSTQVPFLNQALANIPRWMFKAKVGFHGTVALGTHAPALAFQPKFWKTYIENFAKMYKMVNPYRGKGAAYYETQIQDLIRRPNYVRARRAGLVNDPFTYEDFNNPAMLKYFSGKTGMGNRGYTVLKILRQDLFDHHWNTMPKTLRSPEMAELLADSINHVTGVTKGMSPKGANVALFAPRLLASRAMWLAGDPVKAAGIVANWKNATHEQKYFAKQQLNEKLWVLGTYFSLLALNQGILNAVGSKQKINGLPESLGGKGVDPMKADFLKFKVAGMQGSYGNAMITAARLPVRIYATASGPGGKLRNLVYPDEDTAKILFEYTRSQASPFAGTIADLVLRADFQNRPLPHSERPMPKRLRERGVKPYTWAEYISQQAAPIPIQEGLKEVWGQGFGMSNEQIDHYLKSVAIIMLMGGTGGRVGEDWDVSRPVSTESPNP